MRPNPIPHSAPRQVLSQSSHSSPNFSCQVISEQPLLLWSGESGIRLIVSQGLFAGEQYAIAPCLCAQTQTKCDDIQTRA